MRISAICTMVLATVLAASCDAVASHRPPLYQAADNYREAVREFERLVLRHHYIERCDERLVDDLEDQTSILRSASRHPEISNRFAEAWFKTQTLHFQVEAAIFATSRYPRNLALEQGWQAVIYHYSIMAGQVDCLQLQPGIWYPALYPSVVIPVPTTVHHPQGGTHGTLLGNLDANRALAPPRRSLSVSDHVPGVPTRTLVAPTRTMIAPSSNTTVPMSNTSVPTPRSVPTTRGRSSSIGASPMRLSL